MASNRVAEKDLENIVARINRMTGSPLTAYTKSADKPVESNIGHYHLDYAYGGVTLYRMANTAAGGGLSDCLLRRDCRARARCQWARIATYDLRCLGREF